MRKGVDAEIVCDCENFITKMFIVRHHGHDFCTETRDQEPKDDLDSPSGCHEDGKLGLDSVLSLA